ncbi:MAG: hypothetical protein ACI841_001073 [Planctomycetota bacterium]|jgi:hypothetical protein
MKAIVTAALTSALIFAVGLPIIASRQATPPALPTTLEVQQADQLWSELAQLQSSAVDLGTEAFLHASIVRTTEFLQADAKSGAQFESATRQALQELRDARARMEQIHSGLDGMLDGAASIATQRAAWSAWQESQAEAAETLAGVLDPSPRHGLLAEKALFWLLTLDYGARPR